MSMPLVYNIEDLSYFFNMDKIEETLYFVSKWFPQDRNRTGRRCDICRFVLLYITLCEFEHIEDGGLKDTFLHYTNYFFPNDGPFDVINVNDELGYLAMKYPNHEIWKVLEYLLNSNYPIYQEQFNNGNRFLRNCQLVA